jgi:hypothetical protein
MLDHDSGAFDRPLDCHFPLVSNESDARHRRNQHADIALIALLLSFRLIAHSVFHSVGGTVNIAVARVQAMKAGAPEINDLPGIVHDSLPDVRFKGLRGTGRSPSRRLE